MPANHDSTASISGLWNIDYVHGNKIIKEVANGWTITSVASFISGAPFSMSTGSNNNLTVRTQTAPTQLLASAPCSARTAAVSALVLLMA